MNTIRRFLNWMTGWIVTGTIVVALGFGTSPFSDSKESDANATKHTKKQLSQKMKSL
jgi:hypothetical protein